MEEVHTPGTATITALANFLEIEESETAKALFFIAEVEDESGADQKQKGAEQNGAATKEQFVFAVVRGDMELNETKLTNAIRARRVRPATGDEIRAIGAKPGYGSPVGIDRNRVVLVVDDLVANSPNLVAGANKVDYHFRNVNHGRDYHADIVTDLVAAADGLLCPVCGGSLRSARGVEVGNIFKLGTKYSAALGATYLDENGQSHPIVMGSYGIGSDRMIACIIERHHDDHGIQWPITIAPYQIMLVSLATPRTPEVSAAADEIYQQLQDAGFEVLYDDRDERAGVKFNDADLIGLPIRLTVGGRGLKNGIVEMKLRRDGDSQELPLDDLVAQVQRIADEERDAIHRTLTMEVLK